MGKLKIISDIFFGKKMSNETEGRIGRIERELREGFYFMKDYPQTVTIFGSARFDETNQHFIQAERIASRIATELNYTVVTGGGHGIMEAGNRGAYKAGKPALGLNITLPKEQTVNKYLTRHIEFSYFFIRRYILSFSAEAFIFFPGGYGTMDEFFELATLIQTKKIPRIPLILVGKDFWEPLRSFIDKDLYRYHHTIDKEDIDIFSITDSDDEVIEKIKQGRTTREGK